MPPTEPTTGDRPAETSAATQAPASKPAPEFSTIRTFRGDVGSAMKNENVSLAAIALRESQKKRENVQAETKEKKTSAFALVASILIFIASASLVVYMVFIRNTNNTVVTPVTTRDSLIFADTHTKIDISGLRLNEIVSKITQRLYSTEGKINTVEDVYFISSSGTTTSEISGSDLLQSLKTHIPEGITRSLAPEYMYGIFASNQNGGFLIFITDSYEIAFADMLKWEKTYLAKDLLPILHTGGVPDSYIYGQFTDAVIKNIDARVLFGPDGKEIIVYAFINPTHLVIAGTEDAFLEVLSRYTTPKPVVK